MTGWWRVTTREGKELTAPCFMLLKNLYNFRGLRVIAGYVRACSSLFSQGGIGKHGGGYQIRELEIPGIKPQCALHACSEVAGRARIAQQTSTPRLDDDQ